MKNSFNTKPFSYEDHEVWFNEKKQSLVTTFIIGYTDEKKVGVIRFDEEEKQIKVNIMLNPHYIGKGFGSWLIESGVKKLIEDVKTQKDIVAEIKEDNIASIKAFEKSGFKKNNGLYVFQS